MKSDSLESPDSGPPERSSQVIIIGYGNELRGDDAIGRHIVRAIEAQHIRGVVTADLHQLLPETVELICPCRFAIFVDACLDSAISEVSVTPVILRAADLWRTHLANPESLLALCQAIHGRMPEAWWVRVPVFTVDFAQGLSVAANHNKTVALDKIDRLLKRLIPNSFRQPKNSDPLNSHA
ncbi:MAG TPA: hydrogenase maturation protease [Candidatus Paceibacterota bacterium]|nr:hydrogenase maturation protease [Verrucomicrobiota bacterium]HRY50080.1 hydrogenase maturation protease [Candidatus Paceibacterota bacterium]